jgi:hypothetical protein
LISDGEGSLGDIHLASLLSVVMLFRVTLDCLRFFSTPRTSDERCRRLSTAGREPTRDAHRYHR